MLIVGLSVHGEVPEAGLGILNSDALLVASSGHAGVQVGRVGESAETDVQVCIAEVAAANVRRVLGPAA